MGTHCVISPENAHYTPVCAQNLSSKKHKKLVVSSCRWRVSEWFRNMGGRQTPSGVYF